MATVLYRLAQSKTVGRKIAPDAVYAPFVKDRVPEGISPAAVLGPFRNFQAKLLSAWARAVLEGKPPRDIADLVDAYGRALPAERSRDHPHLRRDDVRRDGQAGRRASSRRRPRRGALPELTALAAEVAAGKLSSHAALAPCAVALSCFARPAAGTPLRRRPSLSVTMTPRAYERVLAGQAVVVTGGAGFLGSFVVERMRRRARASWSRARAEYNLVDRGAVHRLLADARPDLVIHLAAQVGGIGANRDNPGRYLFENAMMGLHCSRSAALAKVPKLVALGTICAYPEVRAGSVQAKTICGTAIPRRPTRPTASPRR